MEEIPWVSHNNEMYIPATLLLKASFYFWAPPNFVCLPLWFHPQAIFPVPTPCGTTIFPFDNIFFLI